jgi:hypothetical protein
MHPISDAKRAANRANAQKSTGPRSVEGKAIAARNATRHGILSCRLILPGESIEDLEALHAALVDEFDPVGTLEMELIEELTQTLWRLRRSRTFEPALLRAGILEQRRLRAFANLPDDAGMDRSHPTLPAARTDGSLALSDQAMAADVPERRPVDAAGEDADDVPRAALMHMETLVQVGRYERELLRRRDRLLDRLEQVQTQRGLRSGATAIIEMVAAGPASITSPAATRRGRSTSRMDETKPTPAPDPSQSARGTFAHRSQDTSGESAKRSHGPSK